MYSILIGILLSNMPFLIKYKQKNLFNIKHIRWIIWLLFYFLFISIAYYIEHRSYGFVYVKQWDFYAITFCLYIIFAYPTIIWRYLFAKK